MFFKNTSNVSRQSQFNPTEPSHSRPSSINKQNYFTRTNDVTPIESRMSLQSSHYKLFNRSGKIPQRDKPTQNNTSSPKLDDFFKKISNYLTISNVLIEQAQSMGNTSGTLLRQIKKLGDRIQTQMEQFKGVQVSNTTLQQRQWNLIKNQLLKRIQQLQSQVQRLNIIVEQHQQNNLKIMIKMNQTQSGNISYFKTQLQQSFKAYKVLQDKVKNYKLKIKQIQNIKTLVERDNEKKTQTISYLQKQLIKNPKDRRASLNDSKGVKGILIDRKLKQKQKQRLRYNNDCSIINSITSSVTSNYVSNNVSINGITGNNYLKCGQITELQDFISD